MTPLAVLTVLTLAAGSGAGYEVAPAAAAADSMLSADEA